MGVLVVTNCTGRKRIAVGVEPVRLPSVRRCSAAGQGVEGLARAWSAVLDNWRGAAVQASELYAGRAFADAKAVAEYVGGRLSVVSAGVGFVGSSDPVPPYELTVADGPASVMPRLSKFGVSTRSWWRALNAARRRGPLPLTDLLCSERYSLVLMALPARYIDLIADDLEAIPESSRSSLRIFTSSAGRLKVPVHLQPQVMPYDERLDGGGSSRQGTRVDFPQRAMRHYVEDLKAGDMPIGHGRAAIELALSRLVKPQVPERRRISDEGVRKLLRENWSKSGGQSSKLLRFLRDEAGVACEQSRFRSLCSEVRIERASGRLSSS
jgi:hypothetical protein